MSNFTHLSQGQTPLGIEDVLHGTIAGYITLGRNVHVLWYIVGFIGNAVSIKIWTLPQMYEVCSHAMYLTAISVCDSVCLFLHIFHYISFFWNVKSLQNTTLCETWRIIYMIPQYVSLFLVIGFIIQKLMAISNPFLSNRYLPRQNAAKQIVGIVIFVTTLSFPIAYLWKTEQRGECKRTNDQHIMGPDNTVDQSANSQDTKTDHDSQFILLYWLTDIVTYIPLITLGLNLCIIIKSRKSSEGQVRAKGDRRNSQAAKTQFYYYQSTLILLSLSFFRMMTYLPNTILLILRRLGHFDPSQLPAVYSISAVAKSEPWMSYTRYQSAKICFDLIENSHLALGVSIYILSSRHFRKEILNGVTWMLNSSRELYETVVSLASNMNCRSTEMV